MVNTVLLTMTGIVLAGGENRRMGADKAFLKLDGRPLIEHVLKALKGVFDRIIIVTNSPQQYDAYGVTVVMDAFDKRGPLTGIYSGLASSQDECNFVTACDMPYLNHRFISYMAGLVEGYDAVVPKPGGRAEPLHAIYRKGLLPLIEKRIQQDLRRISAIFDDVRVRYVEEQEIYLFDPGKRSFVNINTPKEYEEATCLD